jgi:hypothetical protein
MGGQLLGSGRTNALWKTENNTINQRFLNVLKNHGYNLARNFDRGKNRAGEIFFMPNLPLFMFHTLLDSRDADRKKARA